MAAMSMYHASVPVLVRTLGNLAHILQVAEEHASAKKLSEEVLLNYRLFPDMFALSRQVQIATDMCKGCAARLAGVDIPKYEDNEKSFDALIARVNKTIDFLSTFDAAQIDGTEDKIINLTVGGQPMEFTGMDYLNKFAVPNVYFHVTTTYAILRHCGVELGKKDFIGGM